MSLWLRTTSICCMNASFSQWDSLRGSQATPTPLKHRSAIVASAVSAAAAAVLSKSLVRPVAPSIGADGVACWVVALLPALSLPADVVRILMVDFATQIERFGAEEGPLSGSTTIFASTGSAITGDY
ncbi:uncharacterized protein CTRU02_215540 [Colletotrichum truncatum]|uniref:Uncharacterized protein n=2 Tax=Colletotrichum truncatum TaxID=5467 RepID=A0ACC3YC17_COLTU